MPQDLVSQASAVLQEAWSEIGALARTGALSDWLQDDLLLEGIRSAINSPVKTYRYMLPTQLVAKLADASLDCRCLQASRGGRGAFDARTIAHKVVVPFDQANNNVLGGSPEPYVNNPLRVPEVSEAFRGAQKNKGAWDRLCAVLTLVEQKDNPAFTSLILKQVLTEVWRRLSRIRVAYAAPIRISLKVCLRLIEDFLRPRSGGERLLAVASALFAVIGRRFGLYREVRRTAITAADSATGMLADLECISEKGETVVAVEVKDRELTISQIRTKIPSIRERKVSEIFFIAQQGVAPKDSAEVAELINHEFVSGHNVYVTELKPLSEVALALIGESCRHDFLAEVGKQLDAHCSDVSHRLAWAELLAAV